MKEKFLKKGDVFKLVKGMEAYVEVPDRFVYDNTQYSSEVTQRAVQIGQIFRGRALKKNYKEILADKIIEKLKNSSSFKGVEIDFEILQEAISVPAFKTNQFDTNDLIGEYVVTSTKYDGGGTGHGPHDVYPDGWHVTAKKLKQGKYDQKGKKITFYQSGCFTAMNENVPVIRKMKETFK